MFMAKDEMRNTLALTKIKNRNILKRFFWSGIVFALFFIGDIVATAVSVFRKLDAPSGHTLDDSATSMLVAVLVVAIVINATFKSYNSKFSVFPQTNTSRFLSSQFTAIIAFSLFLVLFVMGYFLKLSVFSILANYNDNIKIAYSFNLGFFFTGLISFIMYSAIILSLVNFIGAVLRGSKYAPMILTFLAAIFVINFIRAFEFLMPIFGFLIFEKSVPMFLLKGLGIVAVLSFLTLVINKKTVFNKNDNKKSTAAVALISVFGVVLIAISSLLLYYNPPKFVYEDDDETSGQPDYTLENKIELDLSGIEKGTKLEIVTTNIPSSEKGEGVLMELSYDTEKFASLSGNKLVISYRFPFNVTEGQNLTAFANPRLSARLEGSTVYLDYEYEKNVKVVFINLWSFMVQFEKYKDNSFHNGIGSYEYSESSGYIYLDIF